MNWWIPKQTWPLEIHELPHNEAGYWSKGYHTEEEFTAAYPVQIVGESSLRWFLQTLGRRARRFSSNSMEADMRCIEYPAVYKYEGDEQPVYLAGGISDSHNWQAEVVELLRDKRRLVLINPRRANFPIGDPNAALAQITWEYEHLRKVAGILFWFPCETLCPITLYELGAWSMTQIALFIGVHPDYLKRRDVEIQTRLARPELKISYSLPDVVDSLRGWVYDC